MSSHSHPLPRTLAPTICFLSVDWPVLDTS